MSASEKGTRTLLNSGMNVPIQGRQFIPSTKVSSEERQRQLLARSVRIAATHASTTIGSEGGTPLGKEG